MITKDKWYFECDSIKFTHKFDAIKHSKVSGQPIYFRENFLYNTVKCYVEPDAAWQEILKKHAWKIRHEYEYIRLWFSGGSDSMLILDTFVTAGIPLDEILVLRCGHSKSDFEQDISENYLKKIKNLIPHTKITINNLTIEDYKKRYTNQNWIANETFTNCYAFRNPSVHTNFTDKIYSISKKKCDILGKEKPAILKKNNKWYFYFLDKDIGINYKNHNNDLDMIGFFCDIPEIQIKQSHMLKNYLVKNKIDLEKYHNDWIFRSNIQDKGAGRFLYHQSPKIPKILLHHITKLGDNKYFIRNSKDRFFADALMNDIELQNLYSNYMDDLKMIQNGYAEYFNDYDSYKGTTGSFSKFYCMDDNTVLTVDELFPDGFGLTADKVDFYY